MVQVMHFAVFIVLKNALSKSFKYLNIHENNFNADDIHYSVAIIVKDCRNIIEQQKT